MTPDRIHFRPEDVQYPIPEESVKIPARVFSFPIDQLGKYQDSYLIAIRYVIGKDYQGPPLPENTREVLHILVCSNDGKWTPQGQMLIYADVEHPAKSPWDRAVGYDEQGDTIFQQNGNAGKVIYEQQGTRAVASEERVRTLGFRSEYALRSGGYELSIPHFRVLQVEEITNWQEIDANHFDALLGISKEFTPTTPEELQKQQNQ